MADFEEQDRKITYALNRQETEILLKGFKENGDWVKSIHYTFRKVFFGFYL